MRESFQIKSEPMTPDDVLEIFIGWHHMSCEYGYSVPEDKITHDMSILDWRVALDLKKASQLGEGYNEYFDTAFTREQWKEVFLPERNKKLRWVCELIASKAKKPQLNPYTILGKSCISAGIFLSLTELLKKEGVDIADITSSTKIEKYFEIIEKRVPILDVLLKTEPKILKKYHVEHKCNEFRIWLGLIAALTFIISFVLLCIEYQKTFGKIGLISSLVLMLITWIHAKLDKRDYSPVEGLEGIDTFRDLSKANKGI